VLRLDQPLLRRIWWSLGLLNAVALLVLIVASFFRDVREWILVPVTIQVLFSLPQSFSDLARFHRSPKPRPSRRQLLIRAPLYMIALGILALLCWMLWAVWGNVWLAALAGFSYGLPMITLMSALALMEQGPRKDRVVLISMLAMFIVPTLVVMPLAFALLGVARK
jgi:hypothetical protein